MSDLDLEKFGKDWIDNGLNCIMYGVVAITVGSFDCGYSQKPLIV